jgi:hypothetical protein
MLKYIRGKSPPKKTFNMNRKTLIILIVFTCIFAVGFLYIYILAIGFNLTGILYSKSSIRGTVSDQKTAQPVSGAIVSAHQIGWGMENGRLVWDKEYVSTTTSASDGSFRVSSEHGSSARITVEHPNYVTYEGWHGANSVASIALKETVKDSNLLPSKTLVIGLKGNRPYGWNFAKETVTFNPEEADIFPVFTSNGSFATLTVTAGQKGGIAFLPKKQTDTATNPLIYVDEAPEGGYVSSKELQLKNNNSDGVYFVRTIDGGHYTKFAFGSGLYLITSSSLPGKQPEWSIRLPYVYNPDGTRTLNYQP